MSGMIRQWVRQKVPGAPTDIVGSDANDTGLGYLMDFSRQQKFIAVSEAAIALREVRVFSPACHGC